MIWYAYEVSLCVCVYCVPPVIIPPLQDSGMHSFH